MSKQVFIVWAPYHRRSELLAQHFGATIHYIYFHQLGQQSQILVRYLAQAWKTWQVLSQERPDVIFVQNPPIFAVLVSAIYARFYGARYIIDSHTAAFISSKWRWSVGLHRTLSREALTTIVHNVSQERLVQHWKCPYCVVAYTPGDYPPGDPYSLSKNFNVAVTCRIDEEEPLEVLFEAAGQLKDICFYVTGDAQRLDRRLLMNKPDNICLTGYLSYERYVGLLRGVDAVMDLVNNEHTLLMGGFEAVSLGVPLIVSDWPLLRNYFSLGTVYVPNTVEGICEGVKRMQSGYGQMQLEILLLQEQLHTEWIHRFEELQLFLNEN